MHSILFSVIVDTAISATLSSSSSSNRRNASQINKSHDFVIARINEIQQNQITPRAFLAWKLSVLKCLNSSSFSVLHSSQNYSIEVFQLHWIYKKKRKKNNDMKKKEKTKNYYIMQMIIFVIRLAYAHISNEDVWFDLCPLKPISNSFWYFSLFFFLFLFPCCHEFVCA